MTTRRATTDYHEPWVAVFAPRPQSSSFRSLATEPAERVLVGARYELERRVATERWGSLWLAHDRTTGCRCAMRLGNGEGCDPSELAGRFHHQAETIALIRCENVVDCLDHGEWYGIPFLVTEHQEGELLSERIRRQGALEANTVYAIVSQVARALARAHAVGIVHGGLNPERVLLVPTGHGEVTKVLEFGAVQPDGHPVLDQTSGSSDELALPYYASPEQLRAAGVDWRTDLWSLAVIAYECLSGKRPFDGDSLEDLLPRILSQPAPAIPLPDSGQSVWVHRWWRKASAHDADQRFQSAKELVDALGSAWRLQRLPVPDLEPRPAPQSDDRPTPAADPLPAPQPSKHPSRAPPATFATVRYSSPVEPDSADSSRAESRAEPPRDEAIPAKEIDNADFSAPSPGEDPATQDEATFLAAQRRLRRFRLAVSASLLGLVVLVVLGWLVRVRSARDDALPESNEVPAAGPSSLDRSIASIPGPPAPAPSAPETAAPQSDLPDRAMPSPSQAADAGPAKRASPRKGNVRAPPAVGRPVRAIPNQPTKEVTSPRPPEEKAKPPPPAAAPPAPVGPDYGI